MPKLDQKTEYFYKSSPWANSWCTQPQCTFTNGTKWRPGNCPYLGSCNKMLQPKAEVLTKSQRLAYRQLVCHPMGTGVRVQPVYIKYQHSKQQRCNSWVSNKENIRALEMISFQPARMQQLASTVAFCSTGCILQYVLCSQRQMHTQGCLVWYSQRCCSGSVYPQPVLYTQGQPSELIQGHEGFFF